MQRMVFKNFESIIAATCLALFAFIVMFGIGHSMMIGSDGKMSEDCPLMQNAAAFCPKALQQVAHWQGLFVATPQQNLMLLFLSILVFGVLAFASKGNKPLYTLFSQRFRRYKQDHPDIPLFNYLSLVFANGILQPKLYA